MNCLSNKSEVNRKRVEELAILLSTVNGIYDESRFAANEKVAYHVLSCNNANAIDLTPDQKHSKLYDALYNVYKDHGMAALAKTYIYTPEFIAKHGNWMDKEEKDETTGEIIWTNNEPSYEDLELDEIAEYVAKIEGVFPGFGESLSNCLNDLMYNSVISHLNFRSLTIGQRQRYGLQETMTMCRDSWVSQQMRTPEIKKEIEDEIENLMLISTDKTDEMRNKVSVFAALKKRYELEKRFNREKTEELVKLVKDKLSSAWGIKFDQDGNAINPIEKPSTPGRTKKLINKVFMYLVEDYDVMQIRCNILNALSNTNRDSNQAGVLAAVIMLFLKGSTPTVIAETFLEQVLNLSMDSDLFTHILADLSSMVTDDYGKWTIKGIEKAKLDVIRQMKQELKDHYNDRNLPSITKRISNTFKTFYANAVNLLWSAFYATSYISRIGHNVIPFLTGGFVGWYFGGFGIIGIASMALGSKVAGWLVGKYSERNEFKDGWEKRLYKSEAFKDLLLMTSLNKQDDISQIDPTGRYSMIADALRKANGDPLLISLLKIRANIETQIKSMESRANINDYTSSDIEDMKQVKAMCDEAIEAFSSSTSRKNSRSAEFFRLYFDTVENKVTEAMKEIDSLLDEYQKAIDAKQYKRAASIMNEVNIRKMMNIKSDVIGAYRGTLNDIVHDGICKLVIHDHEGTFTQLLNSSLLNEVDALLRKFEDFLKAWVEEYIRKYVDETAGKDLGVEDRNPDTNKNNKRELLVRNMCAWAKEQIANHGSLSWFDSWFAPARDNTSPIVRMVHERLAEIETITEEEGNRRVTELEQLRVNMWKDSSELVAKFAVGKLDPMAIWDKVSPFNTLNIFAEKDSSGRFTGFMVSDVNRGQFYSDLKDIVKLLRDIHDVKIDPISKNIDWSDDIDDKKWKAYYTDLNLWYGGVNIYKDKHGNIVREGAKELKGENGFYEIDKGVKPRWNRRYKAEYYIDRINILGKDGEEERTNIENQIREITDQCIETVEYKDKTGRRVIRRVPIVQNLPAKKLEAYNRLMIKKQLMLSSYYFDPDENGHVSKIEQKPGEKSKELAFRFYMWNIRKRSYYKDSSRTPNYELYNAVLKTFDDKIEALKKQKADAQTSEESDRIQTQIEKIESDKNNFIGFNTLYLPNQWVLQLIKKKSDALFDVTDAKVQELYSLLGTRSALKLYLVSYSQKSSQQNIPDLTLIGKYDSSQEPDAEAIYQIKQAWQNILSIDKRIAELYGDIVPVNQRKAVNDIDDEESNRSYWLVRGFVKKLGSDQLYKDWLFDTLGINPEDVKYYEGNNKNNKAHFPWLFKSELPTEAYKRTMKVNGWEEAFTRQPSGIYTDSNSSMINEDFDDLSEEHMQINGNREEYDNSDHMKKIRGNFRYNRLYEAMLLTLDDGWKNYAGYSRQSRYKLPQRQTSGSQLLGRAVGQTLHRHPLTGLKTIGASVKLSFSDFARMNVKDEYLVADDLIVRADGSIVDLVPTRWISDIDDENMIDTDLISSIGDFYVESIRYRERTLKLAPMEALYYALNGGEYENNRGEHDQASAVMKEMSRGLYGRTTSGFGDNGRMTKQDEVFAGYSKMFRSILHKRLMSHNWASVIKNAWDSFCNILATAFTGKYVMTRNIMHAFGTLFWDNDNKNLLLLSQPLGINRSFATNMTQALMQLNGVQSSIHERFSGQNKYYLRRLFSKSATLEFEPIDYTAKAIITEAVYDAYRLVWNPNIGKYEFVNESEAELIYLTSGNSREAGYNKWANSKTTLKNAYYRDKNGLATLKENMIATVIDENGKETLVKINLLDIIRPKSNSVTSRALENRVRLTIKQIASVVNGMLDQEDKNSLARNYMGALVASFRGYMLTQSGEYWKSGTDFYDWKNDTDVTLINTIFKNNWLSGNNRFTKGATLMDPEFDGLWNFATNTLDVGLQHKLYKTVCKHFGSLIRCMLIIPEYLGGNTRLKHTENSKITNNEYYQLRNVAMALDTMILTIWMTCVALSAYSGGGDGDDDKEKAAKSLFYSSMLASISERFPVIGKLPFISTSMDIVNALTVGTTLIDDLKYVVNVSEDLINYMSEDEVLEEVDKFNYFGSELLINGSFKGKTKRERNITRTLPFFNIDTLPYLLLMDAYTSEWAYSHLPESMRFGGEKAVNTRFRDFNLNYYKSTSESANLGRAKWYKDIVPTNVLNGLFDLANEHFDNWLFNKDGFLDIYHDKKTEDEQPVNTNYVMPELKPDPYSNL